jgi:hypothetical protein
MDFNSYLRKHQWQAILLTALIFGGLVVVSIAKPSFHQSVAWLEAIAGLGTFLFAGFIWYNDSKRDWKENLPKRMTVQFQYEGRNVMVCHDGLLTTVNDARTWALQIGQQISGSQKLKFAPLYNFTNSGIKKEKKNGKLYNHYEFTYYLTELPIMDENYDLTKGCIEWYPIIHLDDTISYSKGYDVNTAQKMKIDE